MGILPDIELTPPKFENGQITVVLRNFNGSQDLLSRMWAQQKKRIQKEYSLDVAAAFPMGKNENEISCIFIRNIAYAEHNNINLTIYESRFLETCKFWTEDFRAKIEQASVDLSQGISEEEILHSCFPEKKIRNKREARKAAKKVDKAKKRAAKKKQ